MFTNRSTTRPRRDLSSWADTQHVGAPALNSEELRDGNAVVDLFFSFFFFHFGFLCFSFWTTSIGPTVVRAPCICVMRNAIYTARSYARSRTDYPRVWCIIRVASRGISMNGSSLVIPWPGPRHRFTREIPATILSRSRQRTVSPELSEIPRAYALADILRPRTSRFLIILE